MVDLGAGAAARARLAVRRGRPAIIVRHDGVDLLAEVEVAEAAADPRRAAASAAHDAGAAAIVVRVRHAEAVAELMQQRGKIETAGLEALPGTAHVTGVEFQIGRAAGRGRGGQYVEKSVGA